MENENQKEIMEKLKEALNVRMPSKRTDQLLGCLATITTLPWDKIKSVEINWEEKHIGVEEGRDIVVPNLIITTKKEDEK